VYVSGCVCEVHGWVGKMYGQGGVDGGVGVWGCGSKWDSNIMI